MKEPLPKGQPVPQTEQCDALVIGAGPAGLMAAEVMARAGRRVTICEAKPSPARKFLMAGKSGLNLLNAAPLPDQITTYSEAADWLAPMLRAFGPDQIHAWAEGLGQPLFTGSSGRVFPRAMKASPLLRAWLARLDELGVTLRRGWRWTGGAFDFATQDGPKHLTPRVAVLALGGASWARLGSDGIWRDHLMTRGIACTPFQPANMGFSVVWTDHMNPHFGQPIKGVRLMAGSQSLRAEFVLSARGVEGGGIYALSRALREGAALTLDMFPDLSAAELDIRLARRPAKESRSNRLRKALGLSGARLALVNECARVLDGTSLKALPLSLGAPHPMDEAISTAGGIARDELDDTLMLRKWAGTFAAGEMLDWEAPTGGYLLTACLATGHWAGTHAARYP
ncbi:MAG: TIGR03862 family flavoprotein [Rhodobacteraceae bacterium]|nr:TIGR03862 family flavoprotein [Paracoccaceae bacterium]